jgi:hypothetical protein
MSVIKNIHKISLPESQLKKLEHGASLHKRMSNIQFKILEAGPSKLVVRVAQEKHLSGNYADRATLMQRTRELFQAFFPGAKIHPKVIPYEANPVGEIDSFWVKDQMIKNGVTVTKLVKDTDIDKTNISAWVNGVRPMSQPVRSMFYYYFLNFRKNNLPQTA